MKMMKMIAVFLLILISEASKYDREKGFHGKLDVSWQMWLNRSCGQQFKPDDFQWKSVGGRQLQKNEYSWVVVVSGSTTCSGCLISPRHVLTAAHCVETGSRLPLPASALSVYPGTRVTYPLRESQYFHRVVNVTIYMGDGVDLALLEISPNMLTEGLPICMPKVNETIPDHLIAAGTGFNPEHPTHYQVEAVNLTYGVHGDKTIATRDIGKTICPGDSGGPLFGVVGGRHTLFGIASGTSTTCRNMSANEEAYGYFEDVTLYLDWICEHSGVCPI